MREFLLLAALAAAAHWAGVHGAPLQVVRDPAAPTRCFTYMTRASDTIAALAWQLGVTAEAVLRDNAPLRLSANLRMAIKPHTPLRLCGVPPPKQASQLQVLSVTYDQVTRSGFPYRRVDTGLATYWVVPMPVTQPQAASFCAAHGGALAPLRSRQESAEVTAAVVSSMVLAQVDVWVGLKRLANSRTWSGGPPSSNTSTPAREGDKPAAANASAAKAPWSNWAPGSPSLAIEKAACGTLRVSGGNNTGLWVDTPCGNVNPGFVCRFRPNGVLTQALVAAPPPLAKPVVAAAATPAAPGSVSTSASSGPPPPPAGALEFLTSAANDTARMWLLTTPRTMPEAEAYCKQAGGHLASIHSSRGLDQLRQVAARLTGYVWLGLLRGPKGHVWTDGSPVDFVRRGWGVPAGQPAGICTVASAWSSLAGSAFFLEVPCGLRMMFVCRFAP